MSKAALITGGAGFIASHLIESIIDDYDQIILVDNLTRTKTTRNIDHLLLQYPDKLYFFNVSVDNFINDGIRFLNRKITHCYHLAAYRINHCAKMPIDGLSMAIDGFNLVTYCAHNNIKLFFASTASVYNKPKTLPISEDDPCNPHTLYGSSKYYIENVMATFAKTHGLQYSICRFFSVYGPRMDSAGPYTEVIFNWLKELNQSIPTIKFGSDPAATKLDLVYVTDVISAIQKATINYDNKIYNVSSGVGTSLDNLFAIMCDVTNRDMNQCDITVKSDNRTDIELARYGDTSKLQSLGWKSDVSLEQGLKLTDNWIRLLETK